MTHTELDRPEIVSRKPAEVDGMPDLVGLMTRLGRAARVASAELALASSESKRAALLAGAAAIRARADRIMEANGRDVLRAASQPASFRDRLSLDARRIASMAEALEIVAELPDPIGDTIAQWTRPNGLEIQRVRVPLGVIGVIYESRPNVTADAAALAIKSGNAVILRGGSESFESSVEIAAAISAGLAEAGLPEAAVQLVPTADRAAVGIMLGMDDVIDVLVPRGGRSLIERVSRDTRIPVLKHLDGLCHVYVDKAADPAKALAIVHNAKLRRTGVCGSAETLLIHRDVLRSHGAPILADLIDSGCEIRGDDEVLSLESRAFPAEEADWSTEYLDAILSVRVVSNVEEAIAHIEHYGSHHTDSIVTEDDAAAERFLRKVDSAIVLHNASTQFADGGEFGMGAEIGIATGKLHARGPVGAEQLTTYKYVVRGNGQTRP